jgi:nicotinic acid mononucleotide adenylyltransferase
MKYGASNGKGMPTYESLTKLKEITGIKTMYLVQGQDNVESILQGKWSNTRGLLCESNILCIPRDNPNLSIDLIIPTNTTKLSMGIG